MKLSDWLLYFRNSNNEEIKENLKINPIEVLMNSIPQSLIILDTVYSKFSSCSKQEFPANLLKPDKLIRHFVWWFTKDFDNKCCDSKFIIDLNARNDWKLMKPRIKNLLRIIFTYHPQLLTSLKEEQRQLFASLESLGLHGMINFGERALIDVREAVRQELLDHQYRVKAYCQSVEKVIQSYAKEESMHCVYSLNGSQGPAPTVSSHQRLMSLRLSEIKNRLQCNENLLQILQSSIRNNDLERLEEILLKRINYDQDILAQLNYLIRSNTSIHFTVAEDPIVSQILVLFSKGYEKLLKIIPDIVPEDEEVSSNFSSNSSAAEKPKSVSSADEYTKIGPKKNGASKRLTIECENTPIANNTNTPCGSNLFYNKKEHCLVITQNGSIHSDDEKLARQSEYSQPANQLKMSVEPERISISADLTYREHYKELDSVIEEYDQLATKERLVTMNMLDSLPDLINASELRQKILFFVIVVAHRTVKGQLQKITDNVWNVLGDTPPSQSVENVEDLHFALLKYLKQKAQNENFETTYQSVMNQIWQTLSDFNCLKTCKIFISFIRNCVRIAWSLNTTKPYFNLEYKECEFYTSNHRRCENSNFNSKIIKLFIWPGLVEVASKKFVYPAIVLT